MCGKLNLNSNTNTCAEDKKNIIIIIFVLAMVDILLYL